MIQQIKPTRMELLKLKKRIALAKKGYHLLKEKRDALFTEFYKLLKDVQDASTEAEEIFERAYSMLAIANAQFGSLKVSEFAVASSLSSDIKIGTGEKNIMGACVPLLDISNVKRNALERGYSILESGSAVDETASLFEESLEKLAKLAVKEAAIERLTFEIVKTKRKVNSLEKIVIPKMESLQHYVEFRLEEREREQVFMLKKIKKKIGAKKLFGERYGE